MSDVPGYIHGYSEDEAARLLTQAEFLARWVFDGVDLDGVGTLFEAGVGVGAETRLLRRRWPRMRVVGCDISDGQLAHARRVLAEDIAAGQVELVRASATAVPLPDASADAVFVSTAWHWLDPERAVPEIARVLRPGGRLGVIWTSRDRDQDWVAELDLLRLPGISDPDADPDEPRTVAEVRASLDRHHTVTLPAGAEFTGVTTASFGFTRTVTVTDAVEWLATNSAFITASAADRATGIARCRAALLERTGGAESIEMPLRSWCWRADRTGQPVTERPG